MRKVVVIGLGRVGLPLACVLADSGFTVVGIDADVRRVEFVNNGIPPFLENNMPELLSKVTGRNLTATTSYESVQSSDYVIITVGTPVDDNLNPVLSDLNRVLDQIGPYFRNGQTVILRSTVSPGTTAQIAKTLAQMSGKTPDKDFFVAFCPERIAEGKSIEEIRTIPQIIGGIGPESVRKAKEVFDILGIETLVADALSSELAKLFSNMYRYINFAIANEFMMICSQFGSNYEQVRYLVNYNYQRGGLMGAGLTAGPCLYKDGFFLLDHVPFTDLIGTSWRINENTPNFLVNLVQSISPIEDKAVAILGMAFKANIDDTRQSLSFRLKKLVEARGGRVLLHDPLIAKYASRNLKEIVSEADIVMIAAPHNEYRNNLRGILAQNNSILVCDVWNICGAGQLVFEASFLAQAAEGRIVI